MGTYEEYIKKSNNLFNYIGGAYDVKPNTFAAFKIEYKNLLDEVAFAGKYPMGTSQEVCSDPISAGYMYRVEASSFSESELNKILIYFSRRNINLEDTRSDFIGSLAAVKFKRRFVIITKNAKNIRAIQLVNELFYKTPKILIITIDSYGKIAYVNNHVASMPTVNDVRSDAVMKGASDICDLPTTGWNSLD